MYTRNIWRGPCSLADVDPTLERYSSAARTVSRRDLLSAQNVRVPALKTGKKKKHDVKTFLLRKDSIHLGGGEARFTRSSAQVLVPLHQVRRPAHNNKSKQTLQVKLQ